MSAIFISHSSLDGELARSLERLLAQRDHHSVFLDFDPEKGIVGGQNWERTLYRKLRACRVVIALITDRYLASHWCFAELALARMEGKQLLALKVDPLDPQAALPVILAQEQFIDLRGDSAEGQQRLWRALAELDLPAVAGDWDPSQPPYPGLSAYQEKDAPVFFGREAESLAGVELLERGAPNLVMVLGASGSGKSSLALAGMLPRLRSRASRWIISDPFRPGRDPLGELVESLARTEARLALNARNEERSVAQLRLRLREALQAGAPGASPTPPSHADERLHRLLELLERLHVDPPPQLAEQAREHLAWSLDDLRRLLDAQPAGPPGDEVSSGSPALVTIARDIARLAPRRDARVLIVIDQFEELLGHAADEPAGHEARRFLRLLREALDAEHGVLTVLATMRSDFLGPFQRDPALQGVDFESLSLGPMRVEGMRRVIEAPARLAAIEMEPGLVERLIEDTATADALPLLSFTLSVLYRDRSDSDRITLADYKRAGGLQGTIGREADAVLAAAARGQQVDALRAALLQMARLSESGGYARVAVEWSRPEIQRAKPALDKLVERRVLVSRAEGDTPVVEVAHEALFRTWAPLRAWLDNARAELLLRQQLERDAATWQASGRIADHLWRGGRLLQANEWLRQTGGVSVADPIGEFVRAGLRRRWRLRTVLAVTTLGVIGLLAGFLVHSLQQTELARDERARALDLARVSVAAELLNRDPTSAALMLLDVGNPEGTRLAPRRLSEALHRAVVAAEFRHAGPVHSVAIDGAGRRVLTTSGREAVIWDARSGHRLRVIPQDEDVTSALFDPGGRVVLVGAGRAGEAGKGYYSDHIGMRAWAYDAATGKRLFAIERGAPITLLQFSADGRWLLVGAGDGPGQLWDMATGQAKTLTSPTPDAGLAGAEFSRDGRWLITLAGQRSQRWRLPEAEPAAPAIEHGQDLHAVAFSPDGTRVAYGGYRGVQLMDTAGDAPTQQLIGAGNVRSLAFSPDGRWVLSASYYEGARVWSAEDGGPRFNEAIVHAGLRRAVFSDDGALVITLPGHDDRRGYGAPAHDNSLRFWDAQTGESRGALTLMRPPDELMSAAFDASGYLMVANAANRVGSGRAETLEQQPVARLWHVEPKDRRALRSLDHGDDVRHAAFSPDGQRVLTVAGSVVRIWGRSDAQPVLELRHDKTVNAAAFSGDGRLVVSASDDGTARVWDAASGRERFVARHKDRVKHAALVASGLMLATHAGGALRLWKVSDGSAVPGDETFELTDYAARLDGTIDTDAIAPDGRRVAVRKAESVQVWDVQTPPASAPRYTLPHDGWVRTVVFIEGGAALVTGGDERVAHVWDVASGNERFRLDHGASLERVAVSPDGGTVLTLGENGKGKLWSSENGQPLHELAHGCGARGAAFFAGGRLAATWSEANRFTGCPGRVLTWEVQSGQPLSTMPIAGDTKPGFSSDGRRMWGEPPAESVRPVARVEALQVWDVATAEQRFAEPFLHEDRIQSADFSPDGQLLLTAAGRQVTVWVVGGRDLQAVLDAATTVCLTPAFRRQNLGETEGDARRRHTDCERKHGRE